MVTHCQDDVQGRNLRTASVGCGHVHPRDRAEFRLGWDPIKKEILYHMDFYTDNPSEYYNSRKEGFDDPVHIQVESGAPLNGPVEVIPPPHDGPWGPFPALKVPPYTKPLSSAPDKRGWWEQYRPLVLETGPLGPVDQNLRVDREEGSDINPTKPGSSFQGIRMVSVRNNVMADIAYVKLALFGSFLPPIVHHPPVE